MQDVKPKPIISEQQTTPKKSFEASAQRQTKGKRSSAKEGTETGEGLNNCDLLALLASSIPSSQPTIPPPTITALSLTSTLPANTSSARTACSTPGIFGTKGSKPVATTTTSGAYSLISSGVASALNLTSIPSFLIWLQQARGALQACLIFRVL